MSRINFQQKLYDFLPIKSKTFSINKSKDDFNLGDLRYENKRLLGKKRERMGEVKQDEY